MVKRFLACLLALMLMCPTVLAQSSGYSFSPDDMVYLYGLYQQFLDEGYDITFEEFIDVVILYLSLDDSTQDADSGAVVFTSASTYLPDPHYFFRGKLYHGEKRMTGGRSIAFNLHIDNAKAGEEYISLLSTDSRFNLKLRTSKTVAIASDSNLTYYVFDYTGSADVDWIAMELVGRDRKDRTTFEAPVIVSVKTDAHFKWYDITIHCSDDFIFVETEDRTTVKAFTDRSSKPDDPVLGPVGTGSGSMGGSSGGSTTVATTHDSSSPYGLQCTACKGTGKCSTCDGRGYLYSSASGKYDRNCYKCNTTGRCSTCGGTGKR